MPLKFQAMSEFQDAKAEAAELEKKAKRWAKTVKLRVSCKAKKLMAYQKDNTIIQIVCMLVLTSKIASNIIFGCLIRSVSTRGLMRFQMIPVFLILN